MIVEVGFPFEVRQVAGVVEDDQPGGGDASVVGSEWKRSPVRW
ncbi:hypothetical protein ACWGPQ_08455 [Saccharomonospora azurea]